MFPTLATRYDTFLGEVFQHLAEEMKSDNWPGGLSELDIQSLWFAGEFGKEFTTTCGRQVKIRDLGVWNHSAGPDFIHCALEIDGEVQRGAIEIDPDVRDWDRHGHGSNAEYEQVILHLFLSQPSSRTFTKTASNKDVPQVELRQEMLAQNATPKRLPSAKLGKCATPLAGMSVEHISSLLEAAAQYRLHRKSQRLKQLIDLHGREQAIYQVIAAALGYRPNQRAFTILTQRLPLRTMQKLSQGERESLLFGVSGFLESVRYEDTQPDTRAYLRECWSTWWKQRHAYESWLDEDQMIQWKLAGIRPGNHPQRRLGALAAIISDWKKVIRCLLDVMNWNRKEFSDVLLGLTHSHWSSHYTLLADASSKPIALLGATRIQELLANIAYPLLVPEKATLWEEYKQLPAALDNQKVTLAALRLFGETIRASAWQKRLFHQQGLLQIYEDYCLEDDSACEGCPFPEKLKQWR